MTQLVKSQTLSNWTTLNIVNKGKEKTAEIDIEGVIGFEQWWDDDKKTTTKELMKTELKNIASLDVGSIIVRINSYGGDVNHGVSMYDLLRNHPAKVTTEVHGHTASAATIIAQAGDNRRMSSTGLYLTHQAQTMAMGTAEDMEATKKTLDTINNQIAEIYAKRNGRTVDEMREVMDRNRGLGEWLTADEALELGLIDEVTEPMAAVASAAPAPSALVAWNLPEPPKIESLQTENETQKPQKQESIMDWLINLLNLTPEQAEVLDELPQSVESVKAEMQANIDAIVEENDKLKAQVTDLEAKAEKFDNAESIVAEFAAKVAQLEADNAEKDEKIGKMTANVKPIDQTEPANDVSSLVEKIHAKVEETGKSYEDCASIVFNENQEIYAKIVNSRRK